MICPGRRRTGGRSKLQAPETNRREFSAPGVDLMKAQSEVLSVSKPLG